MDSLDYSKFIARIRSYFFYQHRTSGLCHYVKRDGIEYLKLLESIAMKWPYSVFIRDEEGEHLAESFIPGTIGGVEGATDKEDASMAYNEDSVYNTFPQRKSRRMFAAFAIRTARRMIRES